MSKTILTTLLVFLFLALPVFSDYSSCTQHRANETGVPNNCGVANTNFVYDPTYASVYDDDVSTYYDFSLGGRMYVNYSLSDNLIYNDTVFNLLVQTTNLARGENKTRTQSCYVGAYSASFCTCLQNAFISSSKTLRIYFYSVSDGVETYCIDNSDESEYLITSSISGYYRLRDFNVSFGIDTPSSIIITVDTLKTNVNTPKLTGTINDVSAEISITVDGQTVPATNNGDGTWTLADNTLAAVDDGTYDVTAKATVESGSSAFDETTNELTIDTVAPTITVDSLSTVDTKPSISGTVNDNTASILISIGEQTVSATNNGDGTWVLAGNLLTPLVSGIYNVIANATDNLGNSALDATNNELNISEQGIVPAGLRITVDYLSTRDSTPSLTGTVNDNTASILIKVDRQRYRVATNNGDGTWKLANNALTKLRDGKYDVVANATDSLGNSVLDETTNELTIDTTAPSITVKKLSTSDTTPGLSGTINDKTATISIRVSGQTVAATNNRDGTWTLADNVLAPLGSGKVYNVVATATDSVGNSANDRTSNELTITGKKKGFSLITGAIISILIIIGIILFLYFQK